MLEYYVMRTGQGVTMWLDQTKSTWSRHFHEAAAFDNAHQARVVAERQCSPDQVFYVMGCMESDTGDNE